MVQKYFPFDDGSHILNLINVYQYVVVGLNFRKDTGLNLTDYAIVISPMYRIVVEIFLNRELQRIELRRLDVGNLRTYLNHILDNSLLVLKSEGVLKQDAYFIKNYICLLRCYRLILFDSFHEIHIVLNSIHYRCTYVVFLLFRLLPIFLHKFLYYLQLIFIFPHVKIFQIIVGLLH